jgi:chromosome segregation ATPase
LSRIIARIFDGFVTVSRLANGLCIGAETESVHSRSQVRSVDVDDHGNPKSQWKTAMVSITSVSITPTVSTALNKTAVSDSTEDTSVTANAEASSDTTKVSAGGAPAASGSSSSSSEESDTVKELRKQIAELQKQLQEQQQQLQAAQAKQESAEAKAADVASVQSQIATTSGSLQTATAALLQALQDEGGSTSGSLVSTSA